MDEGHNKLIDDLGVVWQEAQSFQFHDFRNSNYATPKVKLVEKLQAIIDGAKEGKYDNAA